MQDWAKKLLTNINNNLSLEKNKPELKLFWVCSHKIDNQNIRIKFLIKLKDSTELLNKSMFNFDFLNVDNRKDKVPYKGNFYKLNYVDFQRDILNMDKNPSFFTKDFQLCQQL